MKLIQSGEAAELTGLTRQTIQNWMNKGVVKVHKVGKTHYVDADTLNTLADTIEDVKATQEALLKEKEAYEKERREYEEMRHGVRDKVWRVRYLYVMANSAIRKEFYEAIVHLLCMYCGLTPREGETLMRLLAGYSYGEVAKDMGITGSRVLQLVHKAIRKSKDLSSIQSKLDSIELKDEYISELKARVESLKQRIVEIEDRKDAALMLEAEEYAEQKLKEDETYKLLQHRLVDENLSVRTLNAACRGNDINTIGDLISLSKADCLKWRNFGKKSLNELDEFIQGYNLHWSMDLNKYYEGLKLQYIEEWKELHKEQ